MNKVKILVAPTLEIAKEVVNPVITIEAEYGNKTISGTQYTSAHHGVNSNNPAPCNDKNIPVIQEGIILLSHIDLDSIVGCMRALGNEKVNSLFNGTIEYIDVHGPHHIHKFGLAEKAFMNAYWAWNESRGRKERIEELKDVTQEILESIETIERIANGDKELIDAGIEWSENVQKATEERLIKETEQYRLFSTDRVFCGASYYSPKQERIIPAIISFNEKFKSITLSFEDGGKKHNAVEIMQKLFGNEAGGRPGIAGTPRGKEFSFEDAQKVVEELENII